MSSDGIKQTLSHFQSEPGLNYVLGFNFISFCLGSYATFLYETVALETGPAALGSPPGGAGAGPCLKAL